MNLARETEVLGGNLPGAILSTTKSHMTTRSRTSDCSGGKPATNRLSYGAARPYVTDSLTIRWVSLLSIFLAFRQVYVSNI
jgi:hypothetical protein